MAAILFLLLTSLMTVAALPPSSPRPLAAPPNIHCTTSAAWHTPTFRSQDCTRALEHFVSSDYARYQTKRFEFHDHTTPDIGRYPPMLVPLRFTIDSCTVVIAMLWDFPDQPPLPPLPGKPSGAFARVDVLSFQHAYNSMRRVNHGCTGNAGDLGWEAMGDDQSVGVFIMATGSMVERAIKSGNEPSMAAGVLLNSTCAGAGSGVQTS